MEPILRMTLLYDFYSALLTEKQRSFFEMHNFNDLSLNEIGAEAGISPQGVRDLLKRTEKLLEGYESKLGLVERHAARQGNIDRLSRAIDALDINAGEKSALLEMLKDLQ